jgi:hypothetical protein
MKIDAIPADMEEDQTCSVERFNVVWTSERSGVTANL